MNLKLKRVQLHVIHCRGVSKMCFSTRSDWCLQACPGEVSEAVTNTVKSQLLGHCWCFVSYGRDIHSVLLLRTPQIVHSGLVGGHTVKWILRQICLYDYDQYVVSVLQVFSEAKWSDLGWRQAQGIVSSLNLSCTCSMK